MDSTKQSSGSTKMSRISEFMYQFRLIVLYFLIHSASAADTLSPRHFIQDGESLVSANGPCGVCRSSQSTYKCLDYELLSCFLFCSKSHKKRTGCTGKKRISEVPVAQFNDNLVLSDYNLLMEVERLAESSRRMHKSICGLWMQRPPYKMHGATRYRKFRFAVLPGGMLRGLKNKTFYCQ